MNKIILAVVVIAIFYTGSASSNLDDYQWLLEFIEKNEIVPIRNEPKLLDAQYNLGQALFFEKLLSTNKDTACSTCHLVNNHTSDSLRKAIGAGGHNLGALRLADEGTESLDRNTQALFNLDNNEVKKLFWDGRVEVDLQGPIKFLTPLGKHIPLGLENALAAQSLIPIISNSELKSNTCYLVGKEQDYCRNLYENFENVNESIWNLAYLSFIQHRLIGHSGNQDLSSIQKKYRKLFESAYPHKNNFTISDLANALARYQEIAFATRKTPWDEFLKGSAPISDIEVKGARLFFEKYKCNTCHSNTLFSDFDFHSIGVVSHKKDKSIDKGRFEVTDNLKDFLKFRTPSLRNVTLTAPYMHDGSIESLDQAIEKHFTGCRLESDYYEVCIGTVFKYTEMIQPNEILKLIEFLKFLEDKSHIVKDVVPSTVPSGLKIDDLIPTGAIDQ
ncbi:cytochrome c peroxidase [Pseudoalteromonas sp. B5MOD-1]